MPFDTPLDPDERTGLAVEWWLFGGLRKKKDDAIGRAICHGWSRVWDQLLAELLASNLAAGLNPGTWAALCRSLGVNRRHIDRVRDGQYAILSGAQTYKLAAVLKVEVREVMPQASRMLVPATAFLVEATQEANPSRPRVRERQIQRYLTFLHAAGARDRNRLAEVEVIDVFGEKVARSAGNDVRAVAHVVGRILDHEVDDKSLAQAITRNSENYHGSRRRSATVRRGN